MKIIYFYIMLLDKQIVMEMKDNMMEKFTTYSCVLIRWNPTYTGRNLIRE